MNRLIALLLAPFAAVAYVGFVLYWFYGENDDLEIPDLPEADEELTEAERSLGYTNNGY